MLLAVILTACGMALLNMEIIMGIQKAIVALIGAIVTLVAAFTDLEPDFAQGLVEPVAAILTAMLGLRTLQKVSVYLPLQIL